MGRIDQPCCGQLLIMAVGKRLKRDDKPWADAFVCLSCDLPVCNGTDQCFRSRKKLLNHGRTTSEPRETVEEQSKTGTGGEQVEAVVKR